MAAVVLKTVEGLPEEALSREFSRQPELKRFGKDWKREFIPLNQVNVCGQQRRDFDEGPLEVLANSIEQEGQLHDAVVFRYAPDLAERYVELTNELWGTKVDFADFYRREDGFYDILDAGERRLRSMIKREEDLGEMPGTYGIDCKVRYAGSFAEVIKIQFDENLHEGVASEQGAKAIRQAYFIGKKEGLFKNVQDFLKFSSLREDATRNALAYFELPVQVREMVEKGDMSFSMAVKHVPLMRAAYEYYVRLLRADDIDGQLQFVTTEQIIASAQGLVLTEAAIVARRTKTDDKEDHWTHSQAIRYLNKRISEVQSQTSLYEMSLRSAAGLERDQQRNEGRRLVNLKKTAENLARLYLHLRENGIELEVGLPPDFDPNNLDEQQLILDA